MTADYTLSWTVEIKVYDETALREHAFNIARAFDEQVNDQTGQKDFTATDEAVMNTASALMTSALAAVQALPGVASVKPLRGTIDPPE